MHRKPQAVLPFTVIHRALVLCSIIPLLILASFTSLTHAAEATLSWDPNTESDLAGYKIYYGFQTGTYDHTVDVGNQTTYTVTALEENRTIYFVATAYNSDGVESDYSKEVVFEAVNQPPTADAGPDQSVEEGKAVTLSGTNSTDPEGGPLSYSWVQTSGPIVDISNSTSAQAGFTAPDVDMDGESLIFRLTVTDETGLAAHDYCTVNVSWVNQAPTANAGPDVSVVEGDEVILDGFDSSDPDDGIAAVQWQQISGPEVEILDPTQAVTSFIAPQLTSESASLTFELAVMDAGGLIDTDTCVVNVSWVNTAPTADAGPDQTVNAGDTVRLDGSGSMDPDDGIASIRWSQTKGTPVTFSDPKILQPTFTAPSVENDETLRFELTITDTGGLVSQDTCIVTLNGDGLGAAPTLNITANNSNGTVEVFRRRPVSISISVDPGDLVGETVDVWLIVETPDGRFFYSDGIGWETVSMTYLDTPLQTISREKVFNDKLPVGNYTFTLAVDDNADELLDRTWTDTVSVEVW